MRTKITGIRGGMGADAMIDLFPTITKMTPASKDQDHLRIIVDSNPKIPDRTDDILDKGLDPVPVALKSAKNLAS